MCLYDCMFYEVMVEGIGGFYDYQIRFKSDNLIVYFRIFYILFYGKMDIIIK